MTSIRIAKNVKTALAGAESVVVVAPKGALADGWHRTALGTSWASCLDRAAEDVKPGDLGGVASTYGPDGAPRRLVAAAYPDKFSRHASPTRGENIRHCVAQAASLCGKKAAVVVHVTDAAHLDAASIAVARCFPTFDATSAKKNGTRTITVVGVLPDGKAVTPGKGTEDLVDIVRSMAHLVDTPPEEMRTSHMEDAARAHVKGMKNVKVRAIRGDRLLAQGMGGIHAVGRTATVEPRLVVLEYTPRGKPRRKVALVGKGIIYDTGGLSLKVGGSMPNMKCDMGGAAAVLGAFLSLVRGGSKDKLFCLLCLAENAIGPDSYRPDDILKMHSGKTVEINNTDAEGRLVLADGVSYAARDLKADVIIDAATLTGAALIATGEAVSCTVSNRDGVEARAVAGGRATGDLTHPLLFLPEYFKQEFASKVADMCNSVKTRTNAQSSCAGQFIYNHIEDVNPAWLHLDIAGPAFRGGRGTGYGVALIRHVVENLTAADLAQ